MQGVLLPRATLLCPLTTFSDEWDDVRSMTAPDRTFEEAHCRGCGYPLRGLPGSACPECGRTFDRSNPRTFDHSARVSDRRRWANRAVTLILVALPSLAVCPQGVRRGFLAFKCQTCGTLTETRRWELAPPPWIPFRYPGSSTTRTAAGPPTSAPPCAVHRFDVSAAFESPICKATANRPYRPEPLTINGRTTTPQSAAAVLADLMHPSNTGVGP